jgi:hypothetical protein
MSHPAMESTTYEERCANLEAQLTKSQQNLTDTAVICQERYLEIVSLNERLDDAERWIAAVKSCAGDTFECPECGRSEPWWIDSNADYQTGERAKRLAAAITPPGEKT